MRIGNRLGGSAAGLVLIAVTMAVSSAAAGVERVRPVPLGGSIPGQAGDRQFGVFIPTKFGGTLTIKATTGEIGAITGPDGKPRGNGAEVGNDQQGWYTFRVTGAEDGYAVETSFIQEGRSDRLPWNFYYWPTKSDAIHEPWAGGNARVDTTQTFGDDQLVATPGSYIAPGQDIVRAGPNGLLETPVAAGDASTWFPNLYDDTTFVGAQGTRYATPSPMLKYDQIFGVSARSWEAANSQNQDIQRWPGHCLGGAVASILLNEPTPALGSGMTKDELKALWAELGENHYNHRIGDYANEISAGPPRPGYDDCDRSVARFHQVLETQIRGRKIALLGNLRAFPPRGTVNEVWNHGIGKFNATYHAVPGKPERTVRLEIELHANSGSCLNGDDDKPRIVKYEYILSYGPDGRVDETNPYANDWVSVGGEAQYAPLNLLEVTQTRWAGHNPMINEGNIRALDLANGGALAGRFASAPPAFLPVGSYEAGRGPIYANNYASGYAGGPTVGGNNVVGGYGPPQAPSPRRGFFGILGGRR